MMRSFLTLAVAVVFAFPSFSQDYCATDMPDAMMDWLRNYTEQGPSAQKRSGQVYYIPVKVHIVGNDDGSGYYRTSTLLDALCTLNEQYEPVGFHFYMYGDINYVNNTDLYDHDDFDVGNIVNGLNVPDVANVYFVSNPAGACGYFSGWRDFIAIKKSCGGSDNTTVAHEFGHYFSLPHTFYGWEGGNTPNNPERVDGSNCHNSADYFCDTPPDYLSYRWNCPFTGVLTDPSGAAVHPDESLYMSYANDNCQSRFSYEQISAMESYLFSQRSELLDHPTPLISEVEPTENIYPPDGVFGIPSNYTQLKWRRSEGATKYHVWVTWHTNPNIADVDTVVADTSIVLTNLEPQHTYRWWVRPYNNANTCTGASAITTFSSTYPTSLNPLVSTSPVYCGGESNGAATVLVNGGNAPYTFSWSNGMSTANITNLAPGNYMVTVNDATDDSLVLSVDVPQVSEMDIEISESPLTLSASVNGGTPPYKFEWSTGTLAQTITIPGPGEYALTVTDAKGCTSEKVYIYTSIDEILAGKEIRIFPNPLAKGHVLTLDVQTPEAFNANVEVYDLRGRLAMTSLKDFNAGSNRDQVDLSHLESGVYILRMFNERFALNEKLIIQ